MENKSYLISLAPEIIPIIKIPSLFKIDEIQGSYFMFCSDISEESHHFFKIIFSKGHQSNPTRQDLELSLPYHCVLFVLSVGSTDINEILGFRSNVKGDNSQS